MKSLSLSRPLVIMVVGLPGSGKSFFSRQFADMFSAPIVSADFIRHALFNESHYSPDEDALVTALIQNQAAELFKTGKTFVIDGSVNSRAARTLLEKQARQYDYSKLTIWIQTDEPTSRARSFKRSAKRSQDMMNSPMDTRSFERYKRLFNAPLASENVVVVSGKHTYVTQARVVLKKLVAPRDTVVSPREETLHNRSVQPIQAKTDENPRRRNVPIN